MDFSLGPEEALFRDSVRRLMERLVGGGRWAEIDEAGVIPWDVIREMASHGLFAIPVPEDQGGPGGSWLLAALSLEEVGRADPSMGLAVFTLLNNAWPFILARHGDPEVSGEVLEALMRGEAFYGIASTEPSGGSDVAGLGTRAERVDGSYRVYGEKILISGVREALEQATLGGWTLLARTGGEGHRGLTAFAFLAKRNGRVVDGLEYALLETVGRRAISTGILRLRGAEVPARAVLGGEGRGFYVAMEGFTLARILVAAANVGAASWALERAVEWARERRLFGGRPIASFQGVSFPIAEAWVELEAARLLVYRAAWTADRYYSGEAGRDELNRLSAASKLKAVEAAVKAFETAMKTLGGISFVKETNLHRGLLGSLSYLVGAEGTQNIMRYIVARELIGREYLKG